MTGFLSGCNTNIEDTQVQSAGSKTQTPSGRLVFAGHDHSSNVCVWYSDDGGLTYSTAKKMIEGNEISIAVADTKNCSATSTSSSSTTTTTTTTSAVCPLYMNGRGGSRFGKFRTSYWSYDGGSTWTEGAKSSLEDDGGYGGCEGSLVNVADVLYFLEPQGKKRTSMKLYCSKDQGSSWPKHADVNGDFRGGYSDMVALSSGSILAVWEDGSHPLEVVSGDGGIGGGDAAGTTLSTSPPNPDSGNFFSGKFDTDFCT